MVLQNQPQPGNSNSSNGQSLLVLAPTEGTFTQIELVKVSEKPLDDQIYAAIGLRTRNGPTFKSGALLVGADAIYKVDDATYEVTEVIRLDQIISEIEESKEEVVADDSFRFIETVVEIESSDSILIVFSDGSAWSIFENISCEMIARPAAKKNTFKNLIGG